MVFENPRDFLDCIRSGVDLYCPRHELYVFAYSDSGSICCYDVDEEEAIRLTAQCGPDEYWSQYLGWGGNIIDNENDIELFAMEWFDSDWVRSSGKSSEYDGVESVVFKSPRDFINCLRDHIDLYCPEYRLYAFSCDGAGDIRYHLVSEEMAIRLTLECLPGEHWDEHIDSSGTLLDDEESINLFAGEWFDRNWVRCSDTSVKYSYIKAYLDSDLNITSDDVFKEFLGFMRGCDDSGDDCDYSRERLD